MNLVNLKSSPEEAKEQAAINDTDAPEYPYGLCIQLDDESMKKLGLMGLPDVGTQVTLQAIAVVKSTSAYNTQGGESEASVSLQITDMALGSSQSKTAAQSLYGNDTD